MEKVALQRLQWNTAPTGTSDFLVVVVVAGFWITWILPICGVNSSKGEISRAFNEGVCFGASAPWLSSFMVFDRGVIGDRTCCTYVGSVFRKVCNMCMAEHVCNEIITCNFKGWVYLLLTNQQRLNMLLPGSFSLCLRDTQMHYLANYEIEEEIGQGSFATVYKVYERV